MSVAIASIAARARTMSAQELLSLYELSTPDEQRELHNALYVRLRYAVEHSVTSFVPHLHQ